MSLQQSPMPGERPSAQESTNRVLLSLAEKLLNHLLESEFEEFYNEHASLCVDGRRRIVRNGYVPVRDLDIGIGGVQISVPRVRDRQSGPKDNNIRFNSKIIPPYMRQTLGIHQLVPWALLRATASGDFHSALLAVLGAQAPWPTSGIRTRLQQRFEIEYESWRQRDLSNLQMDTWWANAVEFDSRLLPHGSSQQSPARENSILILVGADSNQGYEPHLLGVHQGSPTSSQSWQELLWEVRSHGARSWPQKIEATPQLGFWGALQKLGWK